HLIDRQTHQRLHAGQIDPAALLRVLVVESHVRLARGAIIILFIIVLHDQAISSHRSRGRERPRHAGHARRWRAHPRRASSLPQYARADSFVTPLGRATAVSRNPPWTG